MGALIGLLGVFAVLDQSSNNAVDDGWAVVQGQCTADTDDDSRDGLVQDAGSDTDQEHAQCDDFTQSTLSPAYQQSVDVVKLGTAGTRHCVIAEHQCSHGSCDQQCFSPFGFEKFLHLVLQGNLKKISINIDNVFVGKVAIY